MKAVIKFKGNIKLKLPYGKIQIKELEWNEEAADKEFRNMLRVIMYGLCGDEEIDEAFKKEFEAE